MRTDGITQLRRQSPTASTSGELTLPTGDLNAPAGSFGGVAAKYIFGHYPTPNAVDVALFLSTVGRTLGEFPGWVIIELVKDRTGIVAKKPFAPRISELVDFCEALVRAREWKLKREAWDEREARLRQATEEREAENKRVDDLRKAAMSRLDGSVFMLSLMRPVPGMDRYQARYRWECAFVRKSAPDDLAEIVDVLNANADLIEEGTKAEMEKRGTGWPTIEPQSCAFAPSIAKDDDAMTDHHAFFGGSLPMRACSRYPEHASPRQRLPRSSPRSCGRAAERAKRLIFTLVAGRSRFRRSCRLTAKLPGVTERRAMGASRSPQPPDRYRLEAAARGTRRPANPGCRTRLADILDAGHAIR